MIIFIIQLKFLSTYGSLYWKELYLIQIYFNITLILAYFSFSLFEHFRLYAVNFVITRSQVMTPIYY